MYARLRLCRAYVLFLARVSDFEPFYGIKFQGIIEKRHVFKNYVTTKIKQKQKFF
jgi:hypothetical protein